MKAGEFLNLLQISRKTPHVYPHDGRVRYTAMTNRQYNYNKEDVLRKKRNHSIEVWYEG